MSSQVVALPEVSVVIPSYNHAAYISEAVSSVLNQSYRDLELIVVDDGSTDSTLDILTGFADPRLKIHTQTNQGAHVALNKGLNISIGDYLAILNSDDVYSEDRLEKCISVLKANPNLGLVGTHIEIVDQGGARLGVKHGYFDCEPWLLERPERSFRAGDDLKAALLTENYYATTSNFVFSRQIYDQVGDFKPLRFTHDWDFALRVAKSAALDLLPEALLRYRVHPKNTIRENQAEMIFEICWILAVHLPDTFVSAEQDSKSDPDFIERLLNSIYVFGMERILNIMLLQQISQHPERALSLLEADNPIRKSYMRFIQTNLKKQPPAFVTGFARDTMRRFYARLAKR